MIRKSLLLLTVAFLTACGEEDGTFAQYPGFAEYYTANPRSSEPPSSEDRELLRRYRPRLFIGADQEGPIGFYADYIAHGTLTLGDGTETDRVERTVLNAARDDPRAEFDHDPPADAEPRPVAFARSDRFRTPLGQMQALSWYFTFRHSGLVADLPWWKEWPARILADADDWHELDHYTAFRLILLRGRPVAVWVQQHHFMRTWLIGEGAHLPADGRFPITAALRSNELYPHAPGRKTHRAVSFPTPEQMRWLILGGDTPMMSGHDITDPVREVDYGLEYPPHSDAFYSFQGLLGEKRLIWPRSGPPGADYNTLPAIKPLWRQLVAGYWREGNRGDAARVPVEDRHLSSSWFLAQQPVFRHNLTCLMEGRQGCDLQ